MIPKKILALVYVCVFISSINAQTQLPELTKKDSTAVSYWLVGLGYNIIDDSGDVFDRLFDIEESWHAVAYPSRINVGRYFENGLGIEAIAAYVKYSEGKRVDRETINENKEFLSFDTRLSYDLNKIVGETGWFDPYVGIGLGYTRANSLSRGTFNGVLGFRTWFSDNWAADVNTSGKWSLDGTATNYLQHAVGVVYRFDKKKELTKKGKKKLALINQLKEEQIKINDSIALIAEAKESARLLEEKLARERENNRIAKLEEEKQKAKNKELQDIKSAIQNLDKIYFAFNSSNLNSPSKNILTKLAKILNDYPELIVEISAHTDSRGAAKYNQILSEKRLKSTIKYLLENQGILPKKVEGKAFGEEKLLNECNGKVKCSEEKHKQNRRSEIKILNN